MTNQEREICNQIYEENRERLNWFTCKKFSWINTEDMHDIMQNTWYKLSENIETVAGRDKVAQSYWLMKVCYNEAVSFLRKQGNCMHREKEYQEKILESRNAISMEDKVIDKLITETLLKNMTEKDKALLLGNATSSREKMKKSNAENCKIYRTRKMLKQRWRESGWDG